MAHDFLSTMSETLICNLQVALFRLVGLHRDFLVSWCTFVTGIGIRYP